MGSQNPFNIGWKWGVVGGSNYVILQIKLGEYRSAPANIERSAAHLYSGACVGETKMITDCFFLYGKTEGLVGLVGVS